MQKVQKVKLEITKSEAVFLMKLVQNRLSMSYDLIKTLEKGKSQYIVVDDMDSMCAIAEAIAAEGAKQGFIEQLLAKMKQKLLK